MQTKLLKFYNYFNSLYPDCDPDLRRAIFSEIETVENEKDLDIIINVIKIISNYENIKQDKIIESVNNRLKQLNVQLRIKK